MSLDERSPVPLYYQLQEVLRARIESGIWRPGEQVPPETELCQEFNLSRGTVRQALGELAREGLIQRHRGKGSFIAEPPHPQSVLDAMRVAASFTDYARQVIGQELASRVLRAGVVPASPDVAERLGIAAGDEVVEVRKLISVGERPFFLLTSSVPHSMAPTLEEERLDERALYHLLGEKYGLETARVEGWFEPMAVRGEEASLLDVEAGDPAIRLIRTRSNAEGTPFLTVTYVIRKDMCRLTLQASLG